MCHVEEAAVEVEKLIGSSGDDETGDDRSDLISGNGDSTFVCGDGTRDSSSSFGAVSTFSDFSVRRRRSAGFVLRFSGSISESDSVSEGIEMDFDVS